MNQSCYVQTIRLIPLLPNIDKIMEKNNIHWICKFLDKNNIIYSFQFDFRQHYSTSNALANLTETMMKALDDGNFACGICC